MTSVSRKTSWRSSIPETSTRSTRTRFAVSTKRWRSCAQAVATLVLVKSGWNRRTACPTTEARTGHSRSGVDQPPARSGAPDRRRHPRPAGLPGPFNDYRFPSKLPGVPRVGAAGRPAANQHRPPSRGRRRGDAPRAWRLGRDLRASGDPGGGSRASEPARRKRAGVRPTRAAMVEQRPSGRPSLRGDHPTASSAA